jgi:S1-C subfamily serine protease
MPTCLETESQEMRISPLITALFFSACALAPLGAQDVEDVFSRVQGSVVTLRVASRSPIPLPDGRVGSDQGLGSGVLFTEEGDILTASHVVQTADVVAVEFPNGMIRRAEIISSDPVADVARVRLVEAIPEGFHPAPLGNSDDVRVGSQVLVVGAPFGVGHTLSVGHVSARRLTLSGKATLREVEYFQTDAAIYPGNSGGPMFNLDGEIVGIVSHLVRAPGVTSGGLGFAVTSNVVRQLVVEGRAFWSGVDDVIVQGALSEALNIPDGKTGFLIQRVAVGSPCEALGLQGGSLRAEIEGEAYLIGGDILLGVMGIPVELDRTREIQELLRGMNSGDELEMVVLRAGKVVGLTGVLDLPGSAR